MRKATKSHTHCQVAQKPTTRAKIAKEYAFAYATNRAEKKVQTANKELW